MKGTSSSRVAPSYFTSINHFSSRDYTVMEDNKGVTVAFQFHVGVRTTGLQPWFIDKRRRTTLPLHTKKKIHHPTWHLLVSPHKLEQQNSMEFFIDLFL